MKYIEVTAASDGLAKLKKDCLSFLAKRDKATVDAKRLILKKSIAALKSSVKQIEGISKLEIVTKLGLEDGVENCQFYANITAKIANKRAVTQLSKLKALGCQISQVKASDSVVKAVCYFIDVDYVSGFNVKRTLAKFK
jgi:hypothetical protein